MSRNIACIIARTNSTRLPKKVLREISGVTMIEYIIAKIKKTKLVNEIYLCTSTTDDDKILLEIAVKNGIKGYAGSPESVIDRLIEVGEIENADNVIRITGDNIFSDEKYIDLMIKYHIKNQAEYTRVENLPLGITSEVIDLVSLKKCRKLIDPDESQYLMLYMFQPKLFKCQVLIPQNSHNRPELSFTVDTPADFEKVKKIISAYPNKDLDLNDILKLYNKNNKKLSYPDETLKFPANLIFSFAAYRKEMEYRLNNSTKVYLNPNEYK